MRELIRNIIGMILLGVALITLFAQSYFDPFWLDVTHAGVITMSLYLIYDGKKERFKTRIELLRTTFKIKVSYEKESKTFTYFCLDQEITKKTFLELVEKTYELSARKSERFVRYFEEESRGNSYVK